MPQRVRSSLAVASIGNSAATIEELQINVPRGVDSPTQTSRKYLRTSSQ